MLTKLTLLGKSDATISIILENLGSCNLHPNVIIVNNLNLPIDYPFNHPGFTCQLVYSIPNEEGAFALGVSNAHTKMKVMKQEYDHLNFINIIHKSAIISPTATLGKGLLINSLAYVGPHTKMGDFVNIGNRAMVNHHSTLEDFVSINPGANIAGHTHIGRGTLIGIGATVSNGITIGKNSIIGAGAIVVRDIPDNVVAYGNPCKPMRENG